MTDLDAIRARHVVSTHTMHDGRQHDCCPYCNGDCDTAIVLAALDECRTAPPAFVRADSVEQMALALDAALARERRLREAAQAVVDDELDERDQVLDVSSPRYLIALRAALAETSEP